MSDNSQLDKVFSNVQLVCFYFVSDSSKVINLLFFFHTFLLKSSFVSVFDHISPQYVWITSQIWYYNFVFRKFIRFPDIFRIFSGFFRIFLKSSDFNTSYHILLENWWYTSWIWYDYFLFQNLSGFFRIFSGLFQIFICKWFWQYFSTVCMIYISNMIS